MTSRDMEDSWTVVGCTHQLILVFFYFRPCQHSGINVSSVTSKYQVLPIGSNLEDFKFNVASTLLIFPHRQTEVVEEESWAHCVFYQSVNFDLSTSWAYGLRADSMVFKFESESLRSTS